MSNDRVFDPKSAARLEIPERLTWMPPQELIGEIGLQAGMHVADIGAGTGFFSFPFAHIVGPTGRVYAVDLQPEMLAHLRAKFEQASEPLPIELYEGSANSTGLADACCDLALLANVWHELDEREPALNELQRILRPGGRIAILDARADLDSPPGPPKHHRIAQSEVERTLSAYGWTLLHSDHFGVYSYLIVAARP